MIYYEKIDPVLQKWGLLNGISWLHKYQDSEIRTFFGQSQQ